MKVPVWHRTAQSGDAAQAGSKDLAYSAPTSLPCAEPCSPSCSEGTTVSTNACSAQAQPPSPQRGAVYSNPSTPRTPRSTRTFSIEPDPVQSDSSTSDSASPGASYEAQVLRQQLASALVRLAAAERQRDAWAAKYREASHKASVLSQRYEVRGHSRRCVFMSAMLSMACMQGCCVSVPKGC